MFVLEVKVHSYGVLSIGGITAMVIGSMMLVKAPIPELKPSLKIIIPVALGISLILIFLVTLVIRAHMRKATTGKEGLMGEMGTALTDLSPEGRVFVHGEYWQAEADAPVPKGSPIKVIQVYSHLKLRVTKANDGNK
jgi:membrane-bound serine protease (ClpP class)